MAGKDQALALAIAEAVYRVNPELILFGQSGRQLIEAGRSVGLQTASEVFADRTYESDGSLTPRDVPGAVITDDEQSVRQVLSMLQTGKVASRQGPDVSVEADTICLHGDGPHAVEFAKRIRHALEREGISVRAIS